MTALAAGSAPSPRTIVADLHALPSTAKRVDELELAGLRPGRDTLTTARKLYGGGRSEPDDSSAITWRDPCRGQSLHVEAGDAGVIQFITVQAEDHSGDCRGSAAPRAHAGSWRTGRGLALGDAKTRVIDLYGAPNSGGPSTDNHQELDMLYYAFDWAGSDVPQVMEVYSDRATGRVAEITLSGPSL
jgi:hypothetical protein